MNAQNKTEPPDTIREWGCYDVLAETAQFKVKRISIKPKMRFSLQRHRKRDEHWYIIEGEGRVTIDTDSQIIFQGNSVDIKRGQLHRLENIGTTNLVFIEIQTGNYFGEDDIERIDDDFGRAEK